MSATFRRRAAVGLLASILLLGGCSETDKGTLAGNAALGAGLGGALGLLGGYLHEQNKE